jgi:hypothetical protein
MAMRNLLHSARLPRQHRRRSGRLPRPHCLYAAHPRPRRQHAGRLSWPHRLHAARLPLPHRLHSGRLPHIALNRRWKHLCFGPRQCLPVAAPRPVLGIASRRTPRLRLAPGRPALQGPPLLLHLCTRCLHSTKWRISVALAAIRRFSSRDLQRQWQLPGAMTVTVLPSRSLRAPRSPWCAPSPCAASPARASLTRTQCQLPLPSFRRRSAQRTWTSCHHYCVLTITLRTTTVWGKTDCIRFPATGLPKPLRCAGLRSVRRRSCTLYARYSCCSCCYFLFCIPYMGEFVWQATEETQY